MLVTAAFSSGCGGDSKTPGEVTTANVSVEPKPFCNAVSQRRELGRNLPELPLFLHTSDVDNFAGDTALACNTRQITYLGPESPLSSRERPALGIRFYFLDGIRNSRELVIRPESNEAITLAGGTPAILFFERGQGVARFTTRHAVVDVRLGCVEANQLDNVVACRKLTTSKRIVRRQLLALANRLAPELRRIL